MFKNLFGGHSYQSIPEKDDEERREDDVEYNPVPVGTSTNQMNNNEENIRFRGDKRLIERGGDFHQSTGKIALRKKIKRRYFRALYGVDLFHSLVDAPTTRIIGILMGTYMTIVIMFALIYWLISRTLGCNLDIVSFSDSFAFSLETMATIGYSTSDIFFDDCPIVLTVLSMQVCVKLIADAVTIGVLYCKLSRPHARASTVIFTNKAIIRRIRGKLYFMFQLCELRKHQLVEAHVRVYVVRNEVDLSACFESDVYNEDMYSTNNNTSNNSNNNTNNNNTNSTNSNNNTSNNNTNNRRVSGMYSKHSNSVSTDDGSIETHSNTHSTTHSTTHSNKSNTYNTHQYHTIPYHHTTSTQNLHSLHTTPHTSPLLHTRTTNTTHTNFAHTPPQHHTHTAHTPPHHTHSTTNPTNTTQYTPPNSILLTQYTLRSTHRPNYMQTSVMRLNHPNDELGGMLLLMTPQVVVHEIDAGSPLMPPPVWFCNFAYDVSGTGSSGPALHPSGLVSGTQLGSHQAGDCIRWRPPAYRNFIHYIPNNSNNGYGGSNSGGGGGGGMRSVSSTGSVVSMNQQTVQFQVPVGTSAKTKGSKRQKHKRAAHRYNEDTTNTISGGGVGTTSLGGSNAGVNKNYTVQPPPVHTNTHTQQSYTALPTPTHNTHTLPTPYNTTTTSEPLWYYDAESLSRIEFPSVVRRIDTDNISSCDSNVYGGGGGNGGNSGGGVNGGGSSGGGAITNGVSNGCYSGVSSGNGGYSGSNMEGNNTHTEYGDYISDTTSGTHTPIRTSTSYTAMHTTDGVDDYSMVDLASEPPTPLPHTNTHTTPIHNTHNTPIHPHNTHTHSPYTHNTHTLPHTPTHTHNTHYTLQDDYSNRTLRFQSAGLSSYADLLNTMSPSPVHNNHFKSHYDMSPHSPMGSGIGSGSGSIGSGIGGGVGSGSIGSNLHKSMYVMNRPHFTSPVVPVLLPAPVLHTNNTSTNNANNNSTNYTNTTDTSNNLCIDVDGTCSSSSNNSSNSNTSSNSSNNSSYNSNDNNNSTSSDSSGKYVVESKSNQSLTLSPDKGTTSTTVNTITHTTPTNTTLTTPNNNTNPTTNTNNTTNTTTYSAPTNTNTPTPTDNTTHELSRQDSNLAHHYENVRTITHTDMLFDDDEVEQEVLGDVVQSVVDTVTTALPTLPTLTLPTQPTVRTVESVHTPTHTPHTPHILNTVVESGSDSDGSSDGDIANTHHTLDVPISVVNTGTTNNTSNTDTNNTINSNINSNYTSNSTANTITPTINTNNNTTHNTNTTNTPLTPTTNSTTPRWSAEHKQDTVDSVVYDSVGIVDSAKHRTVSSSKRNSGSGAGSGASAVHPSYHTSTTPTTTSTTPHTTTSSTATNTANTTTITPVQLPYPSHTRKSKNNPLPDYSVGIATSDGSRGTPQHTNTNYSAYNASTTPPLPQQSHNMHHTNTQNTHYTNTNTAHNTQHAYYTWQEEEQSMIQRYLKDRQIEIIVIVEGVDAATGGMVQARHSYTSSEIEWDKNFECCVEKDSEGCTTIDFSKFHELVSVPVDAPFAGVVHSCI